MTFDCSLIVGRRRRSQTARRAASTRRELRPLGDPGERGRRRSCSTPGKPGPSGASARRASHRSRTVHARRTARLLRLEADHLINQDRGDSTRRSHVVDDENVVHSARDAVGLPGAAVLEREAILVDPSQSSSEVGDDLLTAYNKNHVTRTTKEPAAPPIAEARANPRPVITPTCG